jgi:hypothetical protein
VSRHIKAARGADYAQPTGMSQLRRGRVQFVLSCLLFAAILLGLVIAALSLDPLAASVP